MCSGEPLTVQAPGTQTRSFCYVSDMVYKNFPSAFCFFLSLWNMTNSLIVWLKLIYVFCEFWRLTVLFDLWKERTLGRSTLEIQVVRWSMETWLEVPWGTILFCCVSFTNWQFYFLGEFTMLELAETVKEVSHLQSL